MDSAEDLEDSFSSRDLKHRGSGTLPHEPESKNYLDLKPFKSCSHSLTCEDVNNCHNKEVNSPPINNYLKIDPHCEVPKGILNELVSEYRPITDSEEKITSNQQNFDFNTEVKLEGLKQEIFHEEDNNYQQNSFVSLPIKDHKTKHLPQESDGRDECLASVLNGCSENLNRSREESVPTESENTPNADNTSRDCGLSIFEDGLNVTEATNPFCCRCQKAKCNCRINSTQKDRSDTDSNCKCYNCRRETFKRKRVIYKCDACDKTFYEKKQLKRHKESNCSSIKLFSCNICMRGFSSILGLKHHNFAFHITESGNHKCCDCGKDFPNQYLLQKHKNRCKKNLYEPLRNTDNTKGTVLVCGYCQKSYRSKQSLLRHHKIVHDPEKTFFCTHCKEGFTNKNYLIIHIQSYHLTERFSCEHCHSSYKTVNGLRTHMWKHNTEKKYVCEICGKWFRDKVRLETHNTVHSGEKPWVCDVCGKRFRVSSNLQQHAVTHSDRRPFACALCGSAFRVRNHLRQHMAVHGLVNTSTNRRNGYN